MVNVETQETSIANPKVSTLYLDKYTDTILNRFREFHYNEMWRNSREWATDYMSLSRAKNEFVGL